MTAELVITIFLFILVTIFDIYVLDDLCSRIRYLEDEHDLHNNYIDTCEDDISELATAVDELQEDFRELRRRN